MYPRAPGVADAVSCSPYSFDGPQNAVCPISVAQALCCFPVIEASSLAFANLLPFMHHTDQSLRIGPAMVKASTHAFADLGHRYSRVLFFHARSFPSLKTTSRLTKAWRRQPSNCGPSYRPAALALAPLEDTLQYAVPLSPPGRRPHRVPAQHWQVKADFYHLWRSPASR